MSLKNRRPAPVVDLLVLYLREKRRPKRKILLNRSEKRVSPLPIYLATLPRVFQTGGKNADTTASRPILPRKRKGKAPVASATERRIVAGYAVVRKSWLTKFTTSCGRYLASKLSSNGSYLRYFHSFRNRQENCEKSPGKLRKIAVNPGAGVGAVGGGGDGGGGVVGAGGGGVVGARELAITSILRAVSRSSFAEVPLLTIASEYLPRCTIVATMRNSGCVLREQVRVWRTFCK